MRSFAPIAGDDQWLRCSHTNTALDGAEGVTLAAAAIGAVDWDGASSPEPQPAGLTFDPRSCLYRGVPDEGQLQRLPWQDGRAGDPVDILAPPVTPPSGDFTPTSTLPGTAIAAVSLAADGDDHLFVLDGGTGQVTVLDLADGHVVRVVQPELPVVDLAADGNTVLLATADRTVPLLEMQAFGYLMPAALDARAIAALAAVPGTARPTRVAVGPDGERWLLLRDGVLAWAVPVADERRGLPLQVDGATDIELDGAGRLVVAGPAGRAFLRYGLSTTADVVEPPLRAKGYDGRGITRTPDGAIGYWRADRPGFRLAIEDRQRFVHEGWVDCIRLDGGDYRRRWGRIFVEACVPVGTQLHVAMVTSDDEPDLDEPEGPSIPRSTPANWLPDDQPLPPAYPPLVAVNRLADLHAHPLYRRDTGSEVPWVQVAPGDRFEVYEAPVIAPPGRYLWVRIKLAGTTSSAPRVRAVRVELPGHDLLERLPATYRRDPAAADFLQRYLGIIDGLLADAEARAVERDLLLDPFGAPTEVLPWLASLVGLTLDGRWPESARRQMIDEAICLFRRRGTLDGLKRMLWIVLGCEPVIVEMFRFRGVGGAFEGDEGLAGSVVGVDLRVGGRVGAPDESPLEGTTEDAYRTHAHRFSVLIPRDLDDDEMAAVRHLLDLHRPAHTIVDVCTVGRGMRVGVGLHVAMTTMVGPGAGFSRSVLGEVRLGTDAVLGNPRAGVRPGGTILDDSVVVDP